MVYFSIIIPHFNIPNMLDRLLQTTPYGKDDVEVIVVDDRSDKELNSLMEIKRRYEKEGVKFYLNKNGKKGAGTCRNIGLKHAIGRWVIFADADDRFTDGLYDFLRRNLNAEEDIIYFKPTSIDEMTGEPAVRHVPICDLIDNYLNDPSSANELKLRHRVNGPVNKMIKRELIDQNNIWFDETLVANDIVFSAKAGLWAKKIRAEKDVLYVITERSNSLVRQYDPGSLRERNREISKRDRFLNKNMSKEDLKKLERSGTHRIMGMVYEGIPIHIILETIFMYLKNGIRPLDVKKVNPFTIPGTYLRAIRKRSK